MYIVTPVLPVFSSGKKHLIGVGQRDPMRDERIYNCVQIVGTGADRRQNNDNALRAVPGSVVDVDDLGTAEIVMDAHIEMRKVRNAIRPAPGHEGAIMAAPAVRIM
jgi:hypothetical protein